MSVGYILSCETLPVPEISFTGMTKYKYIHRLAFVTYSFPYLQIIVKNKTFEYWSKLINCSNIFRAANLSPEKLYLLHIQRRISVWFQFRPLRPWVSCSSPTRYCYLFCVPVHYVYPSRSFTVGLFFSFRSGYR